MTPSVLTASGFTFEQDTVEAAAQWLVGQAWSAVPDGLTAGSASRPPSSAA